MAQILSSKSVSAFAGTGRPRIRIEKPQILPYQFSAPKILKDKTPAVLSYRYRLLLAISIFSSLSALTLVVLACGLK